MYFVGQEERDGNLNINCSMRAPETEESVVSIGILLFAFLSEHCNEMCAPTPLCVTTCGVVSERLGSRYRSGRTHDWLKFKNPNAPVVKREHRQNDNGGDPDERLFAPHPSFHRHDTLFCDR